jgi:hypothetical protein
LRTDDPAGALSVPWLAAITAAAAALRLAHVDAAILGDDEIHLLTVVATRGPAEIPATAFGMDFSIPMALLFRLWSEWMPLSERVLRAPVLLAGCATPLVAALYARRLVSGRAALLVAMAVAVHPMCVFYSRYVRPYGIVALLVLLMLVQLDRHARDGRARPLAWGAALGALASWFHPLALVVTGLAFGGLLVASLGGRAGPAGLAGPAGRAGPDESGTGGARAGRVALAGLGTLALTALLYAPALGSLLDRAVVDKIGADTLTAGAVRRNAAVLAGWPGTWPAVGLLLLAAAGAARVLRRAGRRALPLLLPAAGVPLVIHALSPDSISKYQVLARYLYYVLPLGLVLAADAACAGVGVLLRRAAPGLAASPRADALAHVGAALYAAAWVGLGPLPTIYGEHVAYAHHHVYQTYQHLDDPALRAARPGAADAPAHPFYARLAAADPPVPLVIEWPPPLDYPRNHLPWSQAVHRRPLALYAAEGEPWLAGPRLALDHVVTPERLARGAVPPGSVLLLHRNPLVEAASYVHGRHEWLAPPASHARRFAAVRDDLVARLGPPTFEDRFLTAFELPARP